MKHRFVFSYPFLFFLLFCGGSLRAQKGIWNWPEDRATAEEKKVLYTDYMKQGAYARAVAPLEWLLQEAPNLNPSIYIHGVRIYSALAKESKGSAKEDYQKKTMALFDARIAQFGNAAEITNRKAAKAYQFYRRDANQLGYLRTLLDQAIELNQANIYTPLLLAYMDVLQRQKKIARAIKDEDILDGYVMLMDLVTQKEAAFGALPQEKRQAAIEKLATTAQKINNVFVATVDLDCDFIARHFGSQLRENPTNEVLARRVLGLLQAKSCKNEALYVLALKSLYAHDPSYKIGRLLARRYVARKDYGEALAYYEKIASIPQASQERAEWALDVAKVYAAQNQKNEARTHALKALETGFNGTRKEAHNLIGHLYLSSYEECRKGISRVEDKGVFLAAYARFAKIGNTTMMAQCEVQFPSIAELFELGLKEGEKIHIGCWINEEVVLRKAP